MAAGGGLIKAPQYVIEVLKPLTTEIEARAGLVRNYRLKVIELVLQVDNVLEIRHQSLLLREDRLHF